MPPGGGWRVGGRGSPRAKRNTKRRRGHSYLHVAVNDISYRIETAAGTGATGIEIVRSVVCAVADLARGQASPDADHFEIVRETLLPSWNLGWRIYDDLKLPLLRWCEDIGLDRAFVCAGDDALSVTVCAQLWLDNAKFAHLQAIAARARIARQSHADRQLAERLSVVRRR